MTTGSFETGDWRSMAERLAVLAKDAQDQARRSHKLGEQYATIAAGYYQAMPRIEATLKRVEDRLTAAEARGIETAEAVGALQNGGETATHSEVERTIEHFADKAADAFADKMEEITGQHAVVSPNVLDSERIKEIIDSRTTSAELEALRAFKRDADAAATRREEARLGEKRARDAEKRNFWLTLAALTLSGILAGGALHAWLGH